MESHIHSIDRPCNSMDNFPDKLNPATLKKVKTDIHGNVLNFTMKSLKFRQVENKPEAYHGEYELLLAYLCTSRYFSEGNSTP